MKPHRLLIPLVIAITGCRPDPAPETLDDLCGYIYSHFEDEDTEQLVEAMENLDTWMVSNIEEMTGDGYEISNLDQETVDRVYGSPQDITELVGASLAWESPYAIEDTVDALVFADQLDVFPDIYLDYQRTFVSDETCFEDGSCDIIEMSNYTEASYAGLLEVKTTSQSRIRLIEMPMGLAALHQTWMSEPAELNVDWLSVDQQYYLRIMLPQSSGSLRVQGFWTVTEIGDASLPEGTALSLVLNTLSNQSELLDEYLFTNY